VRDDFFALGGDSLRAVAMLSAVEARLGVSVPLSAFARAPTIEGLAERASSPAQEEPLTVVVQAGDGRAPLWLLHPVGGHVVFGNWLRAGMSPTQPILGIQARGLDGKHAPLTTVEAMAALYVDVIRAAQPYGPYFVAGPSMGGYLAVEIAIRLRALGEEVALLALLDTWGPGYPRPTSRAVRLWDSARALAAMPTWRERAAKIRERISFFSQPPNRIVPPRYDVLAAIASRGDGDKGTLLRTIEAVTRANEQANMTYRTSPFDIPVVLLRATRGMPQWSGVRFDDPTNGWGPYARGGVRTIPFACEHLELVDEPPSVVGRALQAEIDRARPLASSAPSPLSSGEPSRAPNTSLRRTEGPSPFRAPP